jgi:hypothetical protein
MKIKNILIVLLVSLLGTSCADDFGSHGDLFPGTQSVYLYTDYNTFTSDYGDAGYADFNVLSSGIGWHFTSVPSWTKLTPSSGSSSAKVRLDIEANPSTQNSRNGIFYLNPDTEIDFVYNYPMKIVQAASTPYATPEKTKMTFTGASSTQKLAIKSNCAFSISSSYSWVTASNITGTSADIKVSANTTSYARSATLYINDSKGNRLSSFTVEQAVSTITSETKTLELKNTANDVKIKINADVAWNATTSQSWIQVSPSQGQAGSNTITVSVTPNTSVSSRSGYVYFNISSRNVLAIPITQLGYFIKLASSSVSMKSGEDAVETKVYSNTSWRVKSKPSWLTVTPQSGKDTATIKLTSVDNPEIVTRQGEVVVASTVSGINIESKLTVTQAKKNFTFGKNYYECIDTAQTFKIPIVSDGKWYATAPDSWITVSPSSARGNDTLKVSLTKNEQDDARIGCIHLSIGSKTYDITIKQRGKYFIVDSPQTNTFGSKGGQLQIDLSTSDSTWRAKVVGKANWITLSDTTGTGRNATIIATVADNPTLDARSGEIVIEGSSGKNVKIYVYQNGRYLTVSHTYILFFDKGGTSENIIISTDADYKITKINGDWFTVSNVANGVINVKASANNTKEHREGALKIEVTNLQKGTLSVQLPVIQAAKGKTFVFKEGYGEEQNWSLYSDNGVSLQIIGFSEDENWDGNFRTKFIFTKEGYADDNNLDDNGGTNMGIGKDDYNNDKTYDDENGGVNAGVGKNGYSNDKNYDN